MNKIKLLQEKLDKTFSGFKASAKDDCVVLTGESDNYQQIVEAGKIAAETGYFYGVINRITLKGWTPTPIKRSNIEDKILEGATPDALVIGGGIIGCSILRELSRYQLSCLLVEKEEDLAMGASSRNDGCVHVGIDLHKNSAKLKYLLRSRAIYPQLCADLDVPYREDGQSVAFKSLTLKGIAAPYLRAKARANHVPGGVKILSREEMLKIEPHLAEGIKWCAYLPGGACVSPYELTIALGESAVLNGAKVSFNTVVESMEVKDHRIVSVKTNRGTLYPKIVINAAGVFSDVVANMMKLYGVDETPLPKLFKLRGIEIGKACLFLGFTDGEKGYSKNVAKHIAKIAHRYHAMSLTGMVTKGWEKGRFNDPYMRDSMQDFGIMKIRGIAIDA